MNTSASIICAAVFTLAAANAHAGGGTNLTIRNELGGGRFCMDASMDSGVHDGDPVYVFRCHGRPNQRWTITQSMGGQSAIVGIDGFCLDVRGAGQRSGTPVQLYQCHFGGNQKFIATPGGHIKEVDSGKCLASLGKGDRAPIVLEPCREYPNQIWFFER